MPRMLAKYTSKVVFALLFVASFGCGSSTEDAMPVADPIPTEVSLSELCDVLAKAECERLDRCGKLYAPWSMATCQVWQKESKCSALAGQYAKVEGLGHIQYEPTQAAMCRDAIAVGDCSLGFERELWSESACTAVVTGLGQEGSECTLSQACQEGLVCDASARVCPGICRLFKENNESCGGNDQCSEGLFCSVTARVCRVSVSLGSPCELSSQGNSCVDGTFCDASVLTGNTCVLSRGRNTGCSSPYECASGLSCIRNLCSGGKVGDTCFSDTNCDLGLSCNSTGQCAVPVDAGASCSDAVPCLAGLSCFAEDMENRCIPRPVLGESCAGNQPCLIGNCANETCVDAVVDGGACMNSDECLPGRICNDGLCAPSFACRL